MEYCLPLQMNTFGPKKIVSHAWVKKCHISFSEKLPKWHFLPMHENQNDQVFWPFSSRSKQCETAYENYAVAVYREISKVRFQIFVGKPRYFRFENCPNAQGKNCNQC